MSFTQDFFTSRRNYQDGDTRVEREGVLWYFSEDNTLRVGDGVTPGGIVLNSGSGGTGNYILPTASTTVKGGVKIDGTTITINNQVISGFSGNYNDLTNKPTIPSSTNDLINNSGYITLSNLTWNNISNKPTFSQVATTGDYNDLLNKPVLFSGSYFDLTNKPFVPSTLDSLTDVTISNPIYGHVLRFNGSQWVNDVVNTSVSWNDVTGKPNFAVVATTGNYNDLSNRPTLAVVATTGNYNDLVNRPNLFSGNYNDLTNKPNIPAAQIQSDWNQTNNVSLDFIKNKPIIPSILDNLTDVVVTNPTLGQVLKYDGNKWVNGEDQTGLGSVSWNDILNKPTFSTVASTGNYNDLTNKPNIPAAQIQSDWNQTNTSALDFIKNKPFFFSGDYNDLTNKPNLAGTYSWNIAADDSTTRFIGSGETIKFKGGIGITTFSDAEGNITINGFSGNYSDLANLPTLFSGNYNDLTNKPNFAGTYVWNIAADDSTLIAINSGESVKFKGGVGITTSSDSEGNITITGFDGNYSSLNNLPLLSTVAGSGNYNDLINKPYIPLDYTWNIAADDSSQRKVSNGETIKFIGLNGVSTITDSEGNIFISGTNYDLSPYATISYVDQGLDTKLDKTKQYKFNVAADDSTQREISSGETVKISGSGGVTTSSDSEGNITIHSDLDNLDTITTRGNTTTNNINVGSITASGNINPSNNNIFYLGSPTNRWHTLYVGPGSLDIDGAVISNIGGNLAFNSTIMFKDFTTQESAPHFYVAGQDSTQVKINNGETVKISGTSGIGTIVDIDGNVVITGPDLSPYATTSYVNTQFNNLIDGAPNLLNTLNELASALNDDANFATNIITTLNNKLDISQQYKFNIAADDSTVIEISRSETVQFVGFRNITTSVNSEGKITITGPDLSIYALDTNVPRYLDDLLDVQLPPTIPSGYVLKWDGNKWSAAADATVGGAGTDADTLDGFDSNYFLNYFNLNNRPDIYIQVAADDSTVRTIHNTQTLQFIGSNGISTNSDSNGIITITGFSGDYNDLSNKPSFKVSLIGPTGTISEETTNVTALRFDTESAFDLTDLGNGEVKVQMNSTFKYWKVDGQQDLVAIGLDTIKFEAGTGITITTNPNASPYQILKIQGFSGDYNDLTNKPNLAGTYSWNIAADDSTSRIVSSGETIKISGTQGISTSSDIEGNITISGPDLSSYETSNSVNIKLETKLDKSEAYKFFIAADDSSQREINRNETIKIVGAQGISTSSDIEGNITITGPDLPDLPSVDIDTTNPIPVGYVLKWNGTAWAPALDDTSETAGTLQVYDEGSTHFQNIGTMNFKGTGVTVTSSTSGSVDVNINTDFIGFNIDGGYPETIYGGINPIDAGHI